MFLKIQLIANLFILLLFDVALLFGGYSLYQKFDLTLSAVLLAMLVMGVKLVFDTVKVVNNMKSTYIKESVCDGDCGDNCCSETGGPCCMDEDEDAYGYEDEDEDEID